MYVCHCRVVNDRRIRETIHAGARTTAQVARACGAGATCGGCVPLIRRLLDEHATLPCPLQCPLAAAASPTASTAAPEPRIRPPGADGRR
jgi:bacterioferritin-associated ferredoxin